MKIFLIENTSPYSCCGHQKDQRKIKFPLPLKRHIKNMYVIILSSTDYIISMSNCYTEWIYTEVSTQADFNKEALLIWREPKTYLLTLLRSRYLSRCLPSLSIVGSLLSVVLSPCSTVVLLASSWSSSSSCGDCRHWSCTSSWLGWWVKQIEIACSMHPLVCNTLQFTSQTVLPWLLSSLLCAHQ